MSKYAGEQVLVIPRADFEKIGIFEGIKTSGIDEAVAQLLHSDSLSFIDRADAEEDPSFKQLIPYAIFRCGNRILHYTRGKAGGESRLHAKLSVGVGGHINPIDGGENIEPQDRYDAAIARELDEELILKQAVSSKIIALLNDESNTVGQVHLGIVHVFELENEDVQSREDALLDLTFSDLSDLNGEQFERLETWSQFCIRHLAHEAGLA